HRTSFFARESMCGVGMSWQQRTPRSPKPWSSETMMMTFGQRDSAAVRDYVASRRPTSARIRYRGIAGPHSRFVGARQTIWPAASAWTTNREALSYKAANHPGGHARLQGALARCAVGVRAGAGMCLYRMV